ncbi:MAG: PadR family transcriptional regulator, partial [bacterium]|nr:PadR family transcriptional regulator [bacterium]
MSSIDLVIFGYLKTMGPMNAYDLARKIEATRVKKIVKIGSPTLYQNIKKLAAKNYLTGTAVRDGEMPEKIVYEITESGEEYFLKLMHNYSSDPGRMYFAFNAFIKNLENVDKKTGSKMLGNLKQYFFDMQADLETDMSELEGAPWAAKIIMKQYSILLKGLIEWIEEVI